MGPFNGPTIAILVILAILLFGAKKLPDLARSLGRSARILKAESKGLVDEENETKDESEDGPEQTNRQEQRHEPAPQQNRQGYPQLPPGQRIVNESGEPSNQTHNQ